jgi:hypothetical protein
MLLKPINESLFDILYFAKFFYKLETMSFKNIRISKHYKETIQKWGTIISKIKNTNNIIELSDTLNMSLQIIQPNGKEMVDKSLSLLDIIYFAKFSIKLETMSFQNIRMTLHYKEIIKKWSLLIKTIKNINEMKEVYQSIQLKMQIVSALTKKQIFNPNANSLIKVTSSKKYLYK